MKFDIIIENNNNEINYIKDKFNNVHITNDNDLPIIILEYKLNFIQKDYLKNSLIALSSIYVIRFKEEDVIKVMEKLYFKMIDFFINHGINNEFESKVWDRIIKFKKSSKVNLLNFILRRNILCKDFSKNSIYFFEYNWNTFPILFKLKKFWLHPEKNLFIDNDWKFFELNFELFKAGE